MESLEQAYSEICNGYSEIGDYKFRHFTFIEQASFQIEYNKASLWAKNKGLKDETETLIVKQREGLWSGAKSLHITGIQEKIDGLEKSKPKVKSLPQIDSIWESLQSLRTELTKALEEKHSLLDDTLEAYSENALRFHVLLHGIEKNGERAFKTEEDLDSLPHGNYNVLEKLYFQKSYQMRAEMIKKITIQPFFWLPFSLAKEPSDFFKKAISTLTIYQVNLLKLGQTFAKIASEVPDLPSDYEGCPERMLMYWYLLQNGGKEKEEERENTSSRFLNLANSLRK